MTADGKRAPTGHGARPASGARADSWPGPIRRVRIRGWRSVSDLAFEPPTLCALVGGPASGKSNILRAIEALLQGEGARVGPDDVAHGLTGTRLEAELADGSSIALSAVPPGPPRAGGGKRPPVLMLASELRSGRLVEASVEAGPEASHAAALLRSALAAQIDGALALGEGPRAPLVGAVESCCVEGVRGLVLLIDEPELHLRPHAQRYLYRLLRRFALGGNQVIYTTHSPCFLDVARLDEAAFVRRDGSGTHITQPRAITPVEDFRVLTEFDVSRSELLLARSALLVEGTTEKLSFPYVFNALGLDPDREGVSVVACGGKANIPLFARASRAAGVPVVAVCDRDAEAGRKPNQAMRALNAEIAGIVGSDRTIMLAPDFEAAAGLRGHSHKPRRAWRSFRSLAAAEMPEELVRAGELAVRLARGSG